MSRTITNNKLWMVPACVVGAVLVSLCCWQQLNAQGVAPPAGAAAPGAAAPGAAATPAAASTSEPSIEIHAMLPSGFKTVAIKNWDGTSTEMLKFKYKTLDHRLMNVELPGTYKLSKLPKSAWDTLFCAFALDDDFLTETHGKHTDMATDFINARNGTPSGGSLPSLNSSYGGGSESSGSNPNPTSSATDLIRSSIPAMTMMP